jgi:hypothetical protein
MMIRGIDGKILHLKELGFIEKTLYDEVLSPEKLYREIKKYLTGNYDLAKKQYWTIEELEEFDKHLGLFFEGRLAEAKGWLVRAYVTGRFLSLTDLSGADFKIGPVEELPKYIADAAKQYNLSLQEAKALQMAVENGASLMKNATADEIQQVKEALVETTKMRGNAKTVIEELRKLLSDEPGALNRDLKRLAVSETNAAFNDGYLGMLPEGAFVVGFSMPDACEVCLELISGKVYRVRKTAAPDYSGMTGEEKEKWMKVWELYVWPGKNNIGRSPHKHKRIDPSRGNTKENLREKEHHEFTMPALPLHPECRCRWVVININFQYVEGGRIRLRVENEDAWKIWHDEITELYGIAA